MTVDIKVAPNDYQDWALLLELLHSAFAYQKDRIDPPSSLYKLNEKTIAEKSKHELLILALESNNLAGCLFAKPKTDSLYIGKLAVWPHRQGEGIGRHLTRAAEEYAKQGDISFLVLDTRIELTENHETFKRLGFDNIVEQSHDGYDRTTFITMRKRLEG